METLWFILIAVLFIGFFFLEGFDYGVGILLPFLGRSDEERRLIINTIGPVWDANEVWMITAGGAMFAAFPNWYATLFSALYLPLFLLLVALILRGVAFEFRSKLPSHRWRGLWDQMIFAGSLLAALLWGIAVANMIRGIPINAQMEYVGGFLNLLNPYALVGGLAAVFLFTLHGANYLQLKLDGDLKERAYQAAMVVGAWATVFVLAFVGLSYAETDLFHGRIDPGAIPALGFLSLLSIRYFLQARQEAWAFWMSGLSILLSTATIFLGLYPRVLVSSLNPAWSLTIHNAAAAPSTLGLMTIVALIFLPIVLLYLGWTYWVFRGRITKEELTY
jgi:cytochrome d ubiquinol oxidase subunit II